MDTMRSMLTKWGFDIETDKLKSVENRLDAIKNRLNFLATVEVVKGLFHMTERMADFGEQLHVAALGAGITVESFQKLAFSAGQSAVSQEELSTGLTRLTRNLYMARQGSAQAQEAFAKAGFSPDQIAGFKNSQQVLLALSDRMKATKDPIERVALSQQLLGRGSQRMAGWIAEGSKAIRDQMTEAEKLGLILSEDKVRALKDFGDTLKKLWTLFKALGATIGAEVAPLFKYIINDMIKFFVVNRDIVQLNFTKWLEDVAFGAGFLWEAFKYLTEEVVRFAKAFGFEKNIMSTVMAVVSLVIGITMLMKVVGSVITVLTTVAKVFTFITEAVAALQVVVGLPFLTILAVVGSVILVIHELWAILNGQPTWLQQFWEWIKALDIVKTTIELIARSWNAIKGTFSGAFDKVAGFFGANDGAPVESKFGIPATDAGTALSSVVNNQAGASYSVEAPITVNVPAGTNPGEVGNKVKEGVREHLDRMMRETRRSTGTAVAY
jgi:hypothetical protein